MKLKRFFIYLCAAFLILTAFGSCSGGWTRISFEYPEADNYTKPYTVRVEKGESIGPSFYSLPIPFRLGYYFDGWEVGGKPLLIDTAIKKNYKAKAVWKKLDLQILSAENGSAEIESLEKSTDECTRYNIKYNANEGYYLSQWLVEYPDEEMSFYEGELFVELNEYRPSCTVTPIFTDKLIPIVMNIYTDGAESSDGGIVEYPESCPYGRSYDIKITANEDYYIQSYGFMQVDYDYPNITNLIISGFISQDEIYSLSGKNYFFDTEFGPAEEKEFFVMFIRKDRARVIRARLKDGNRYFSMGIQVVTVGNSYKFQALDKEGLVFEHWEDSSGNILSYDFDCTVTATESGEETIYAVYGKVF